MPEVRPEVEVEPWLSLFFLRPKSLPRAVRKVDFFRFGGAPSLLCAVGASLKVEYRIALGGGFVLRIGGDVFRGGDVLGGDALATCCPDDERLSEAGSGGR
jgi:hypothetical protein